MKLATVYMLLALAGAAGPYGFFIQHFIQEGIGLSSFVAALFATPAGSGFTVDLLVSSAVFWIFLFRESGIHGLRYPWAYVILNLAVGLSCALPLFLCFRERAMAR